MTTNRFPRLFEPLQIGPVTARNRVLFGAHFTMMSEPNAIYGEPGFFGRRLGRYVADRAAGGVGVVVVGHTHVHPSTAYSMRNNANGWDPASVAHYEQLTTQVHEQGALAFIQLSHSGAKSSADWSAHPLVAPSAYAVNAEAPKVLEVPEIHEIVEHFGLSARHAAKGGFDGVEIQGAHHYLVHEFMSPTHNRRDDEYGGSFENRMRFAVEVLTAVRQEVGSGVAVGIRLVGDEQTEDGSGITAEGAAEIARYLEERGLVDFLNVSVSHLGSLVQPMYSPHLLGVYAAKAVKQAVSHTPVFAVHRILTPVEAEGILERGEADGITLVRPLIADPEWVAKALDGRSHEIRNCTGCNQLCYGNLYRSLPIQCVQNPAVGRDAELGLGTLVQAAEPKRVVVVGGGVGGMEAAWVAAARGHEVILLERSSQLGGKIRLAQTLPGRSEVRGFADWRIGECQRRGVDVRLNTDADVTAVLALQPDAVVVATGGRASKQLGGPGQSAVEGLDDPSVVDHEAALVDVSALGHRVLVVDVIGHIEGVGISELIARSGRDVTLASLHNSPPLLDSATASAALRRACHAGVTWWPATRLVSFRDRVATVVNLYSGERTGLEVDNVVIRAHGTAADALYHALVGSGPRIMRVGDAVAVRPADRAIFDGHLAGRSL